MSEKNNYKKKALDQFFHLLGRSGQGSLLTIDLKTAKELFSGLATWAGKSKDEMLQMMCREIAHATANALKEPLMKALDEKRLHVTIELSPKQAKAKTHARQKKRPNK